MTKLDQIEVELKELEDREVIKFDPNGIDFEYYCDLQDQRNRLLLEEKP